MVILVRLEQPSNAEAPILVTPSGMIILVSLEQSLNAESAIPTVFSLNTISLTDLSQSITQLLTYDTLFSTCINLSQPSNACFSMLVMLSGKVIFVSSE